MSEANLHFKIKEYIMKRSLKKELIEELSGELDQLIKIKNELMQNKNKLKEDYNKYEKQKKYIINTKKINNEPYFRNSLYNNGINIWNKSYYNNFGIKRRNFSAVKPKKNLGIDLIKDLKKENNYLEDILIDKNHELNNIIQNVNDMEIKCKLLMFDANKNTNLIEIQKK